MNPRIQFAAIGCSIVLAIPVTLTLATGDNPQPEPSPAVPVVSETVRINVEQRASRSRVRKDPPPAVAKGPTRRQWYALRWCESRDKPRAVSSNGLYHGLYQFDRGTWRSQGGRGVASTATRWEQDMRAHSLYADRGARPWPICGRHLR